MDDAPATTRGSVGCMPNGDPSDLITLRQAEAEFGVTVTTLREWIAVGKNGKKLLTHHRAPRAKHGAHTQMECMAELGEPPMLPSLLRIPEVRHVLKVHDRTVRRWIAEERLRVVRVGGRVRIQRSELLRFLGLGASSNPAREE